MRVGFRQIARLRTMSQPLGMPKQTIDFIHCAIWMEACPGVALPIDIRHCAVMMQRAGLNTGVLSSRHLDCRPPEGKRIL